MTNPSVATGSAIGAGGRIKIIPVIHYADGNQAMRNAERAIEAGCTGVMLIEMRGRNTDLVFAGGAIKRRWPDAHVGINHLSTEVLKAAHTNIGVVDSTWTDEQLTHTSGETELEAARLAAVLKTSCPHTVFCGVAFKYQRHEPEPIVAAARAVALGFVPTTSGPSTGAAADPALIEEIRGWIGPDSPLAIASGITPENVASFAPHVSHILVSTGVSSSFHEFDPARLKALVETAA